MAFTTEELEPPRGSIKNGKWTTTRSIWLKIATELDAFVADLLGVSFSAGPGAATGVSQTYPGKPWLVLVDASYEPMGDEKISGTNFAGTVIPPKDSDGVAQPPNGYKFTLSYETLTFDQGSLPDPGNTDLPPLPTNTFLTVKIDLGMTILATDKSAYEWVLANDDGSFALGVKTEIAAFRPTETLTLTWHRITRPPWTAIKTLRGKLNKEVFLGHPASTVMFIGLTGSREFQVSGQRQWQLDYKFSIKEVPFVHPVDGDKIAGWNDFLRKDPSATDGTWQKIEHKQGSGKFIYETENLDDLFLLETA